MGSNLKHVNWKDKEAKLRWIYNINEILPTQLEAFRYGMKEIRADKEKKYDGPIAEPFHLEGYLSGLRHAVNNYGNGVAYMASDTKHRHFWGGVMEILGVCMAFLEVYISGINLVGRVI